MRTLADSLLQRDIALNLKASDQHDALEEILAALRSDHRVRDWEKLRSSLSTSNLGTAFNETSQIMLLHHGRTESVSELVLAVGRSCDGIPVQGSLQPIGLIFVAAIPDALNNEYLRILGAISRICSSEEVVKSLMNAQDEAEFIAHLQKGCLL